MANSASLSLTLRLLPTPTAAVVAAGIGFDFVSKHYRPALAFSYGHPYDDDVFQVGWAWEARGNGSTGVEVAWPRHLNSISNHVIIPPIAQKEAGLGTEASSNDSPSLQQVDGLPFPLLSYKTVRLLSVRSLEIGAQEEISVNSFPFRRYIMGI